MLYLKLNITQLWLKQQLNCPGEDQTANARAPEDNSFKTVESDSWKNEHELNFRDENLCMLAETKRQMLANMEATVLLLKGSQLQTSSLWIYWWGNN